MNANNETTNDDVAGAAQDLLQRFAELDQLDPLQRERVLAELTPQLKQLQSLIDDVLDDQEAA